jgi:cobalt-precorrin-5B (C1)-methyltransferase
MAFDYSIRSGSKFLRCGYTTGSCAALAAAGAARLLLSGEAPELLRLVTPKGWTVEVPPAEAVLDGEEARCAVRKDAGDDPDVTDGCLVCAAVRRAAEGIRVFGGAGVGRVTKPGLDRPVGAAAINSVPRRMILQAVEEVCEELGYSGGLSVVISVPGGEQLAHRTFNPMLGIEGGISILGTTGIVEPMSEQALIDTVELELRQAAALSGKRLILTTGSYGEAYLRSCGLDACGVPTVKCSNFIGEALDAAAAQGFSEVLLVGHIGKLVKLAGGIMNTHSRQADCRMELFTAHAALCGADTRLCAALMEAVTADACLALLDGAGLKAQVLESLLAAIQRHLDRRASGRMTVGAVVFSNEYGGLGMTAEAERIRKEWA